MLSGTSFSEKRSEHMRQQDLVWVRLPFSSLKESKVRPAVVVSNDAYNKREDIVVCAVTSKLATRQYSIVISQKDVEKGRLPIKSRVRADKILQIEKKLIIRPFARLENKTFDVLVSEIMKLVKRRG